MTRIVAIALVCLFSFALTAPLLQAGDSEAKLPPCCRKDGKHRCAMRSSRVEESSRGPGQMLSEQCPCWPNVGTPALFHQVFTAAPTARIYASLVSHPTPQAQTEARWRISFACARQKRGPPSLL